MFARTFAGCRTTSYPATTAAPEDGRSSVDKILIVVVFPAPLWPSSAQMDPVGTEKLTSCTARTPPSKVLAMPLTSITNPDDTAVGGVSNPEPAKPFEAKKCGGGIDGEKVGSHRPAFPVQAAQQPRWRRRSCFSRRGAGLIRRRRNRFEELNLPWLWFPTRERSRQKLGIEVSAVPVNDAGNSHVERHHGLHPTSSHARRMSGRRRLGSS